MNILSLFDGMCCGRISLDRAGIKVDKYYASELDKYAITVTQANWPNTIQLGDVTKWREWDIDWPSIDLLIGGSPCQGFSFAGKQLAFDDPRSALFFEYLNILNHIKSVNPKVKFLLENVRMKKEYLDLISSFLKVEPVFINSELVSAQCRKRYYWANWEFMAPKDKKLVLSSIIEEGFVDREKSRAVIASVGRTTYREYFKKNQGQLVFNKDVTGIKCVNPRTGDRQTYQQDRIYETSGKMVSLTSSLGGRFNICEPEIKSGARRSRGDEVRSDEKANALLADGHQSRWLAKDNIFYRKLTPVECERLQTVPDDYTNHVSNSQRYKMIGNGWTIDVIAHIFKGI
ncbi:MAG: DNA (cytosine-5-)-methyltransferase [Flavobacterium sp.]|nr:MAG: DNA (cytosine-5-)-methyltransferase [Flavobacterium sp.]